MSNTKTNLIWANVVISLGLILFFVVGLASGLYELKTAESQYNATLKTQKA